MSEIEKKENTQNSLDSIDFNSKSQILNSPRSLLACKKLGINPSELYYISLEDYKNKNLENKNLPKDILDIKYEEFENYRNKSIEQVKEDKNGKKGYAKIQIEGDESFKQCTFEELKQKIKIYQKRILEYCETEKKIIVDKVIKIQVFKT